MGRDRAPALDTIGRSASAGRSRNARWIVLETSVAARSMSRPMTNSTLITLIPKPLVDSMVRMPSMPFSTCSIGSVIVVSTVSGLAPA